MLTKNFERLQAEVADHVKADRVAQRSYESCFIGCLANGHDDPGFIESKYGIPVMVTRIAESIFEGLPADEAPSFFAAIPQAVAYDGKDLSRVGWQFLAAELRALPPVPDDIQACIDSVIEGMDLLADGKEWPEAAVKAANAALADVNAARVTLAAAYTSADAYAIWSAASAADAARATLAAAWAAADAATDAAWSTAAAFAARLRQRDLLLRLISEAPVNALI